MSWKTSLACGISLMVGLVLGHLISSPEADDVTRDGTESETYRSARRAGSGQMDRDVRSSRRTTGDEFSKNLAEESGLYDPEANGPLVVVPLSMLNDLSRASGVRSMSQDLFGKDEKLQELLQVSDKEKASLQRAWRITREKVKQLEVDSSKSEDLPDGSVRITVPDTAEAMAGLGEEFQSTAMDVLGGNRAEAFLAVKQVGGMFNPSGGDRIYTVRMEDAGNGQWRYHMSFEGADGSRKAWVGGSIPAAIRHLTDKVGIQPGLESADEDSED